LVATVAAGSPANLSDFKLTVTGGFVFDRTGTVSLATTAGRADSHSGGVFGSDGGDGDDGPRLVVAADGLHTVTVVAITPAERASPWLLNDSLVLSLETGTAAFSTAREPPTLKALVAATAVARAAAMVKVDPAAAAAAGTGIPAAKLEAAATAMQAAVMWNVIYHPTQAGPFVQVSRSFAQQPCVLMAASAILRLPLV
jgi:hypothetical protein